MKNIFTILAAVLLLASCSSEVTDTNDNQLTELQAELAREQIEFDSLKSNFDLTTDAFSEGGWYQHKRFGTGYQERNTLSAVVGDAGIVYLISHYQGPKALHHDAVRVKVGDQILESESVDLQDKLNRSEIANGKAHEQVHYTRERDNGILQAIAAAKGQEVVVRLEGVQRAEDFTLSPEDQQAISDCVRLAQLIRTLPDKEAQVKRLELGL